MPQFTANLQHGGHSARAVRGHGERSVAERADAARGTAANLIKSCAKDGESPHLRWLCGLRYGAGTVNNFVSKDFKFSENS